MHKIKVIEGFIEPEDCKLAQSIIANSEYHQLKYNNVSKECIPTQEILEFLKKYSIKAKNIWKDVYGIQVEIYPSHAGLNLWEVGVESLVHKDHHEGSEYVQLSSVSYFNDDFEGGEIYFPEFDFTYKPKAGEAIFFPSFTKESDYKHGVKAVTEGKRYTMGLWFTQFEKFAYKELI